ncbi:UcrQ family-domain-containing protein [Lophiotrema nucula]|uniref:Cytochrome b-c1 complex subunit 8 n=1 Tax=Lophiotrema nucula TaxID=690887 RepID=A0A6A5ZI36_9PLEO|nr:UcrQ family-domain-containing protein [Lophiotrema nucula]
MAGGPKSERVRNTWHIGGWGNPFSGGGQPGKGTTTYALSPNRQRPFAGLLTKAPFNTFRRVKNQVLYVVPPFVIAYYAMQWSIERNEYLNSKAGRAEFAEDEE